MSDSTYQTFQHYGTHAERLAFTPNPAAGIKPLYLWYETDTSKIFLYHTSWTDISPGAPGAHAASHSSGASDPVTVTNLAGFPGGTTNFLRADGTFAAPPSGSGGAHATTHKSGGTDVIKLDELAAPTDVTTLNVSTSTHGLAPKLPNDATKYLDGTGAYTVPTRTGVISLIIDGGTSVITTGVKAYLEIPFACTIQAATLLADVSGSIVVDVWKDTYANYPPTVADTITASAKPTISSATKSQDSTLTGWTKTITAGNILGFNVDSVTSIKKVTLSLKITI